jgi:hypothetical protein
MPPNDEAAVGCCPFFKSARKVRGDNGAKRPNAHANLKTTNKDPAVQPLTEKQDNLSISVPNSLPIDPIQKSNCVDAADIPLIAQNSEVDMEKNPRSKRTFEALATFRNAATKLENEMSRLNSDNRQLSIPETIGFQNTDNIDDVRGTAKQLESAIDDLVDSRRALQASQGRRRIVRSFIRDWFNGLFPYVKRAVTTVNVLLF